jgi:hypothetical protein
MYPGHSEAGFFPKRSLPLAFIHITVFIILFYYNRSIFGYRQMGDEMVWPTSHSG